jgi:hypothetical protein
VNGDIAGTGMIPPEIREDAEIGMTIERQDVETLMPQQHSVGNVDNEEPTSLRNDGTYSEEFTVEALINDDLKVQPSNYNYLSSLGKIGGVSTGPVTFWLRDVVGEESAGQRQVHSSRKYFKACGGQAYMPFLMMLFDSKQFSEKVQKYSNLPMVLTRIFMHEKGAFDADRRRLYQEFIDGVEIISESASSLWSNNVDRPGLCVRVEWYMQDNLTNYGTGAVIPNFPYLKMIRWALKNELMDPLVNLHAEMVEHLRGVAIDLLSSMQQAGPEGMPLARRVEFYPPAIKTAYVYAAERVTALSFNLAPLGKVTLGLNTARMAQGKFTQLFPCIPRNCRFKHPLLTNSEGQFVDAEGVILDEGGHENDEGTGLPYGIKSKFMGLPQRDSPGDFLITRTDLRKNIGYLQQLGAAMFREIHIPKLHYISIGLVTSELLKAERPLANHQRKGIFDIPSYKKIAGLGPEQRQTLLENLSRVLCECYHTEWWFLIRERMWFLYRQFPNLDRELKSRPIDDVQLFPRTIQEWNTWAPQVIKDDYLAVQKTQSMSWNRIELTGTDEIMSQVRDDRYPNMRCLPQRVTLHISYLSHSFVEIYR